MEEQIRQANDRLMVADMQDDIENDRKYGEDDDDETLNHIYIL